MKLTEYKDITDKNFLILNKLPLPLNKLLELINIQLIKIKI